MLLADVLVAHGFVRREEVSAALDRQALVDAHILVDPRISVSEGHYIAESARKRVLSGHDDGVHVSNCRGLVTIERSRFHGLMDDPVNVHGTSVRIVERPAPDQRLEAIVAVAAHVFIDRHGSCPPSQSCQYPILPFDSRSIS